MGTVAKLIPSSSRRQQLAAAALAPDILLGMPHLTPFGLSETWLLKELAHRHWLLLGQSMGLDDADFRMPDGSEVYAAICASALRGADLTGIVPNDILTIRSQLAPASRTRMASTHRLDVDGRVVGEVELISAFVHRANGGQGGAIARVRLPHYETDGLSVQPSALMTQSIGIRRGDLLAAGLAPTDAPVLRRHDFTPSQVQDFNGAGLFYFASYQAVIDRALEAWFGPQLAVSERQTFYLGNIAPHEGIVVKLRAGPDINLVLERATGELIAHQRAVLRSPDAAI